MNYSHQTVNHSKNILNPTNKIFYTQNIESFWAIFKKKIKIKGGVRYSTSISTHFGEFIYRKKNKVNVFQSFLSDLKTNYH